MTGGTRPTTTVTTGANVDNLFGSLLRTITGHSEPGQVISFAIAFKSSLG